ncbi:MAG: RDD family protein [Oligoflexia bacterium]|nr:RDD family protein [Oligoflexia bacterium]
MNLKPAPLFPRLIAFLIDITLVTSVLTALEWFIPETSGLALQIIVSILELCFLLGYFIVGVARYGTTIGKRIFRLRVVLAGENEAPLSWWRCFLRALFLPVSCIMGVGLLMALFNPRRQALHDAIAGTLVVKSLNS